jgi:hypothetical protein
MPETATPMGLRVSKMWMKEGYEEDTFAAALL